MEIILRMKVTVDQDEKTLFWVLLQICDECFNL